VKILVAPNAWKASLSANDAADAIAAGVRAAIPDAQIALLPIADGGDGTAEVLRLASGGTPHEVRVHGPVGRPIRTSFAVIDGDLTAAIDVAAASGLASLAAADRDPLGATSFGTGEIVRAALDIGCQRILIGAGGSATTDGGAGILEALGVRLLDRSGQALGRGGGSLGAIDRIDRSGIDPRIAGATIVVLCDVDAPLLGPSGAARLFGPQKGASAESVDLLEKNLGRFADVIHRDLGVDVRGLAAGGAAGGIAAGLHGVIGAQLTPGTDWVLDAIGFEAQLQGADLVITGEGRLDLGTLKNKGPYGVAIRAKRCGVPVIAIVGTVDDDAGRADWSVFDAVTAIVAGDLTPDRAIRQAAALIERAAEAVARRVNLSQDRPHH
jgi:glycerate 2-kinase